MLTHLILAAAFVVMASDSDTSLRAYAGENSKWVLTELNGAPFTEQTTLTFPSAAAISGEGPCNIYRAALLVPYPWFDVGPVISTRRACPEFAAESAFFAALEAATLSEVGLDTLTLSNETDTLLVFKAAE